MCGENRLSNMKENFMSQIPHPDTIKAVFFDVDGTLFDPVTHQLSKSTADAIRKLKESGRKVGLATARNLAFTLSEESIRAIDWDAYVVCAGGQIYDADLNCLYDGMIPVEKQKKIFDFARENNIAVFYYSDDKKITLRDSYMTDLLNRHGVHVDHEGSWDQKPATMLTYACHHHGDVIRQLGPIEGVEPVSADVFNIDFFPSATNKGTGVETIMKLWSLPSDAYMAFGDTMGDGPMLKNAAIGAAMPWAAEKAKECSTMVCKDFGENSIARALEETGLIA